MSYPTWVDSEKTLFFQACTIWCAISLRSPHTLTAEILMLFMWATCLLRLFFSTNKVDWKRKPQCVYSTWHRAVEARVSASWYLGGCSHARGHNTAQSTLFQYFPAHTHAHTDRQADYTQLVTSRQACTQSQSKTAALEEECVVDMSMLSLSHILAVLKFNYIYSSRENIPFSCSCSTK